MAKFRDIRTLQKFASVHASIHNHFNQDRQLNRRDIFKQNRPAALAEWRWGGRSLPTASQCAMLVVSSTPTERRRRPWNCSPSALMGQIAVIG